MDRGSALDPGPGRGADRPVVPRHLHPARSVLSAAPAKGWSPQAPQRKAAERDDEKIATWVKDTWPLAGPPRGTRTRGSASPTKQANH
ncbi:winged helix-turn-helix domain-containing protein [Nonomuraea deserti]|uniref:winged helix-turn-helix domain-containing protein n=1 Tax=Nonomuraea deserti TaxID=1848322 RepID=UPI0034E08E0F